LSSFIGCKDPFSLRNHSVPNDQALREKVMTEAHSSPFTIHPGS
ncbi:hypothetical protein Tco_0549976, partial [Tanacetum coccineum]